MHRRGTSLGWLLRYLLNPRPGGEHHDPHLIAAWAYATRGDLTELEPPLKPNGRYRVHHLTVLLAEPFRVTQVLHQPSPRFVWHCSVHNHPDDPILSDRQWEHAATEIMHTVGLAPRGDHDAVRWLAIRHADNHVHLVTTLARQDGRPAKAWNDYRRVQAACRHLQAHFGLKPTGPATVRYPRPAEIHKANLQHRDEIPRDRLRHQVRAAAVSATSLSGFATRLQASGLLVRLRTTGTNPDHATGYAVALPDHQTANGDTIWYSGGRLATDLTLQKLRHLWSPQPTRQGQP